MHLQAAIEVDPAGAEEPGVQGAHTPAFQYVSIGQTHAVGPATAVLPAGHALHVVST